MKPSCNAAALISLSTLACTLDLVDLPDPDLMVTRLAILVDATDWVQGQLFISAALRPGDLATGNERAVSDATLSVFGVPIAHTTSNDATGSVLRWADTVAIGPDDHESVDPRLPEVAGIEAPAVPRMAVRRAAGYVGAPQGWAKRSDLRLMLVPEPFVDVSRTDVSWGLEISEWAEDGKRVRLFTFGAATELPDTLVVLSAWLSSVTADSLEATVRYRQVYQSSNVGGAYELSGVFDQRLEWPIKVRER